jgi:hypothetical protein
MILSQKDVAPHGARIETQKDKENIYNETVQQYAEWYGPDHGSLGSCLYWAMTGGHVLLRHNILTVRNGPSRRRLTSSGCLWIRSRMESSTSRRCKPSIG